MLDHYLLEVKAGIPLEEIEKADFRLDDYHCVPLSDRIMRRETWGKMFRNPYRKRAVLIGWGKYGLTAFFNWMRMCTVGKLAWLDENGKVIIPAYKPIAKMIHFEWNRWDFIKPEFKDEKFIGEREWD